MSNYLMMKKLFVLLLLLLMTCSASSQTNLSMKKKYPSEFYLGGGILKPLESGEEVRLLLDFGWILNSKKGIYFSPQLSISPGKNSFAALLDLALGLTINAGQAFTFYPGVGGSVLFGASSGGHGGGAGLGFCGFVSARFGFHNGGKVTIGIAPKYYMGGISFITADIFIGFRF